MLTLRIRSSDGTRRMIVAPEDVLSTLSHRIRTEFSDVLATRGFKLWREGDPARRHLLGGVDAGKSFAELEIKNGEMLYLEPISRPSVAVQVQETLQAGIHARPGAGGNWTAIWRLLRTQINILDGFSSATRSFRQLLVLPETDNDLPRLRTQAVRERQLSP
ncbi:hypothetical protein NliqN6_0071 [Naganishia liquefaciens]|uniref:Nuclear pore localisation protein Npl4 ubiquitin-like domain-containing protein n=1 Tax=Naganishia liquefaciens TaxID=104408 RepID=A0A8H3TMP9_9TREE|nr:hypothetical protein NliqN6_0071 [Naganishia liquefaciens]